MRRYHYTLRSHHIIIANALDEELLTMVTQRFQPKLIIFDPPFDMHPFDILFVTKSILYNIKRCVFVLFVNCRLMIEVGKLLKDVASFAGDIVWTWNSPKWVCCIPTRKIAHLHTHLLIFYKGIFHIDIEATKEELHKKLLPSHLHISHITKGSACYQKPDKLYYLLIKAFSKEGDYILEPMAGSGTIVVVGDSLNRRVIAIEKNKKIVTLLRNRGLKLQRASFKELKRS